DRALRLLDAGASRAPKPMGGGRVPEGVLPEVGQHRLKDFRPDRSGGGVVEIHQALGHLVTENLKTTRTARQAAARPGLPASRDRRTARRTAGGCGSRSGWSA